MKKNPRARAVAKGKQSIGSQSKSTPSKQRAKARQKLAKMAAELARLSLAESSPEEVCEVIVGELSRRFELLKASSPKRLPPRATVLAAIAATRAILLNEWDEEGNVPRLAAVMNGVRLRSQKHDSAHIIRQIAMWFLATFDAERKLTLAQMVAEFQETLLREVELTISTADIESALKRKSLNGMIAVIVRASGVFPRATPREVLDRVRSALKR